MTNPSGPTIVQLVHPPPTSSIEPSKRRLVTVVSVMVVVIVVAVSIGLGVGIHGRSSPADTTTTTTTTALSPVSIVVATTMPTRPTIQQMYVACAFLNTPDISECQTMTSFRNATNGTTIPTEIGWLTQLTWLTLANQALTGSMPSTLGNLTELIHLDVIGNKFIGTIPSTLGNLTQLALLYLDENLLLIDWYHSNVNVFQFRN